MTKLSNLSKFYLTSDATVTVGDLPVGVIAYGASGRLIGIIPFSEVSLLLHMNGIDASTTFTDDSDNAHVLTAVGNAQIDTADSKFGGASGLFDGTGDYISCPYVSADFDWFSVDYTIEAWVKASAWTNWSNGSNHPCMIGRHSPSSATDYWSFGPNSSGALVLYYFNGTGIFETGTATCPTGQWVHIAMTYNNSLNEIKFWIDGTLDTTHAIAGTPQSVSESLIIGQNGGTSINGWLDDVRITKGSIRYTANFTPPIAEHPDS